MTISQSMAAGALLAICLGGPVSAQATSVRAAGSVTLVTAHDGQDFQRYRNSAGIALQASLDVAHGDFSSRIAIDRTAIGDIGAHASAVAVKDAWIRYSTGPADLTIGRQFLPEGRSDRIRPLDQFAPRDLTRIAAIDARQRIALPAARLDYALDDRLTVSIAYVRQDQGYVLPVAIATSLPPGRTLRNAPVDGGLLELQYRGEGRELGVSFTHGASPLPAVTIAPLLPDQLHALIQRLLARPIDVAALLRDLTLRQTVIGQTRVAIGGSYTVGRGVVRFDLAGIASDDPLPGVERRGLFGSIGYDVGLWTDANASVQLIARHSSRASHSWRYSVPKALAPLAQINAALQQTSRDTQAWMTANLRQSFRNEHDIEGGVLASMAGEYAGYVVSTWRPIDHWRLAVQAQGGGGPRDSLIDGALPNFRLFTEVQFSF